jgi:hypothetical protein
MKSCKDVYQPYILIFINYFSMDADNTMNFDIFDLVRNNTILKKNQEYQFIYK